MNPPNRGLFRVKRPGSPPDGLQRPGAASFAAGEPCQLQCAGSCQLLTRLAGLPGGLDEVRLCDGSVWPGVLDLMARCRESARTQLVDTVAAAVWPELRRMAANLVRRFDASGRFQGDGDSIVGHEFAALVRECIATGFRPEAFNAVLWKRSVSAFNTYYQQETSPASGMVVVMRKRSFLRKVQQALRATGVEPTLAEIAERANLEATRRLSDPKRQGMVFTADSVAEVLSRVEAAPLDHADEHDLAVAAPQEATSSPITCAERQELASAVLAEASQMPAPFPRIAAMLWGPQLGEDTFEFPAVAEIARQVGCDGTQAARTRYFLAHTLPKRILAERFGVVSPAVG